MDDISELAMEDSHEHPKENIARKTMATVDDMSTPLDVQLTDDADDNIEDILMKKDSIQIPHLDDPEKQPDVLDTDIKETPDFKVRLGTSLVRKNADVKARHLLKELSTRTVHFKSSSDSNLKTEHVKGRRVSLHRERSMKYIARPLGKFCKPRRRTSLSSTIESLETKSSVEDSHSKDIYKMMLYLKFQKVARDIKLISRICLALKSYVKQPDKSEWSFMEMYLDVRDDLHQKVAFNPHSYVKVEPTRDRLKRLLEIPKHMRKLMDVKMILGLMRDNASFKDYPLHTQIQLATCMEYQSYEARRIILRQGHRASAFYILLSGEAMINIKDNDPRTNVSFVRTVHEMKAGDTFGEIALLENITRTATVICKTPCELLVVQKEDFDEIIKEPLMRERIEHINFCKNLPLFQDFPCDVFAKYPNQFFFQYFKQGEIIVKDIRDSNYIIVVTEGKCQIISDMKETIADRINNPMFSKEMEQSFPLYTEMKKVKAKARRQKNEETQDELQIKLLTGTIDKTTLVQQTKKLERRKSRQLLRKRSTLTDFFEAIETDQSLDKVTEDEDNISERLSSHSSSKTARASLRHSAEIHRPKFHASRNHQVKSAFPASRVYKTDEDYLSVDYLNQTRTLHAQISELKTGSIFGLESLLSRPSTTLSLVSDGVECILISKKLFLQKANIKVLRIVTDLVQNHPCHDYIKEQVYTYRKWSAFKMKYILDVVNRRNSRECSFVGGAPDKKFPLPAVAYC